MKFFTWQIVIINRKTKTFMVGQGRYDKNSKAWYTSPVEEQPPMHTVQHPSLLEIVTHNDNNDRLRCTHTYPYGCVRVVKSIPCSCGLSGSALLSLPFSSNYSLINTDYFLLQHLSLSTLNSGLSHCCGFLIFFFPV